MWWDFCCVAATLHDVVFFFYFPSSFSLCQPNWFRNRRRLMLTGLLNVSQRRHTLAFVALSDTTDASKWCTKRTWLAFRLRTVSTAVWHYLEFPHPCSTPNLMTNCGDDNLRPRLWAIFSMCCGKMPANITETVFYTCPSSIYFSQAADSFDSRPVMGYMLACIFHGIIRWALERPAVWSANYLVCLPLIQGQKISNSGKLFLF